MCRLGIGVAIALIALCVTSGIAAAEPLTVDFEDDPHVGNVTCNAAFAPYECAPAHHAWLISKGIDIAGSPAGFVERTIIAGPLGRTGNIVGYSSPHYGDTHSGVGIGEALTVTLVAPAPPFNLAASAHVVLTSVPIAAANNLPATVTLTALDAGGAPIASTTQTFVGVTNGVLTPATIAVATAGYQIRAVRITASQHPLGGVWLEAVTFQLPDPPPDTSISTATDGNATAVTANGSTVSNAITFGFTGTDNIGVASFRCSLDTAPFAPCATAGSQAYAGLVVGPHTFSVQAVDTAGSADPTPAAFHWSVVTGGTASQNLLDLLNTMGLPASVLTTGFLNTLENARDKLNDGNTNNDNGACGNLNAFISQVDALEAAGDLTEEQADTLRDGANAIKASIPC